VNSLQTYYWIGRLLSLNNYPERRASILMEIECGRINWNIFFYLCDAHRILPAIYLQFERHSLLEYIPVELQDYLANIYKLNKVRNEQILIQIHDITLLLNCQGISPIFLKGAAHLLDGLYEDNGERFMFDIDLIVSTDDFQKTSQILEEDGYFQLIPHRPENLLKEKHYPRLIKDGTIVGVEIHRMLSEFDFSTYFHFGTIDKEKKVPIYALQECFVLSDKHKIIHHLINSQMSDNGFIYGRGDLRQMNDFFLLSRKTDPVATLNEFRYFHRQTSAYLTLASRVYGIKKISGPFTIASCFFVFRHDMSLRSQWWHDTSNIVLNIYRDHELQKVYIRNFKLALHNSSYRRERLRRLFNGTLFSDGIK